MMKYTRLGMKGFSLVELLVVIAMLGVILMVIFSEYIRVLQQTVVTRKVVKTETDVVNVLWPLFKEIESAGFGIPAKSNTGSGSSCTTDNALPPLAYTSGTNTLTIHSTAVGDLQNAGSWSSIVGDTCKVTGIDAGGFVAVINPTGMVEIAFTSTSLSGLDVVLDSCVSAWKEMLAFSLPPATSGPLECGEAFYRMTPYGSNPPTTCAPSGAAATEQVGRIMRSIAYHAAQDNSQPLMECVRDFSFRFGCINKTTGSVTWTADPATCTGAAGNLRFIKIGIIVQESPRDLSYTSPSTVTLFSELTGVSLQKTVNIISTQRNYRWRPIERTIVLRNLE